MTTPPPTSPQAEGDENSDTPCTRKRRRRWRFISVVLPMLLITAVSETEPRRIVVERPLPADSVKEPFHYEAGNDSTPPRLVIDAGEMIYQMRVDSINKVAEEKIKKLIERLERHFNDPKVEEEVGNLIGEVVMAQQMAMLDLQVERALSLRDSLLIKGLEMGLRELLEEYPGIREEILRQLDRLEREFQSSAR